MNKIKYLFLLLFIPINVFAYSLTCDSDVYYGDSFYCHLSGDKDITYDELSGDLTISDESVYDCEVSSVGEGFENNSFSKRFDVKGKTETSILVSYKCNLSQQPNSNYQSQVVINNLKYHELDSDNDVSTEIVRSNNFSIHKEKESTTQPMQQKSRKTNDPNSRLKNIKDNSLDFVFSSFKTEYELEVVYEVEKLDLQIEPNVDGATYVIDGSQDLDVGDNTIDIYVTSPDESSTTCYSLYIKRLKRGETVYYPEKDSSLKSLGINNYPINFEPGVLDYTITINYDVSEVSVFPEANYKKASVEISGTNNLKNGSIITVTVKSEDQSSTTQYLIHIKKKKAPIDVKPIIFSILILAGIVGVTVLIIRTNQKNKEDPLLKLRLQKRKVNKGEKFDDSVVPESNPAQTNGVVVQQPAEQVQTIQEPVQPPPVVQQPVQQVVVQQPQVVQVQPAEQPQVVETQVTPQIVQVQPQPVQPVNIPVQSTDVTPVTPVVMPAQPVQAQVQPVVMPTQEVQPQPVQQVVVPTQQVVQTQPVQQVVQAVNSTQTDQTDNQINSQ